MLTFTLLVGLASLLVWFVWKAYRVNQYWKERGIKHLKPVLFFGNHLPTILGTKSQVEIVLELYNKYPDESILGFYDFMSPKILIRDPDLIVNVLVKDFAHFTDHGNSIDLKKNPRDEQLFLMNGKRWRALRTKISPIFTSGKLKDMYSTMSSVGENLLGYLKERENEEIDARELMGLFSMDIISSAVFGMDPATLKNPNCEFRQKGKSLNESSLSSLIRFWLLLSFPSLVKKLGISGQDTKLTNYFCNIIQSILDYRREKGVKRNDFIELLMQLKEKGTVEIQTWDADDDYLKANEPEKHIEKFELTDDLIMGQALSFMIAGFEATALIMAFTMFELTQHQDYQEKVCRQIAEQVKAHGGLTYEAVKNLTLLDSAIKETQRFHPLVPSLFRVCTKTYELPNGYVISKGENLQIPISAVHLDSNNFPEPEKYKPERFLDPVKQGTFLPFGEGPRICIAMRYAQTVIKYGLSIFFLNYRVNLSEKTSVPIKLNKRGFITLPKEKILLKLQKVS